MRHLQYYRFIINVMLLNLIGLVTVISFINKKERDPVTKFSVFAKRKKYKF